MAPHFIYKPCTTERSGRAATLAAAELPRALPLHLSPRPPGSLRPACSPRQSGTHHAPLLVRVAAGEACAISECVTRYCQFVRSLVRSRVKNPADAEDAIQEIFVNVWRSAGLFDSRIGSEANFVATIARRKVIDHLRAQARLPSLESFDENTFATEAPAACESSRAADLDAATRALDQLADNQRELVVMGIVQGLSHSEIARATGKPLGTVKATIRRGIAKVRAALALERVTSARFADRVPTRPARASRVERRMPSRRGIQLAFAGE